MSQPADPRGCTGCLGTALLLHDMNTKCPRLLPRMGIERLCLVCCLPACSGAGKDHFGWNTTVNAGISHGYERLNLYEGLGTGMPADNNTDGYDDYDRWFQARNPGKDPLATGLAWNAWRGATYAYDEDLHPTGLCLILPAHNVRARGDG